MITIVDSGIANIGSVKRACERIGADCRVVQNPEGVSHASSLILPGVGSFADGMSSLKRRGLIEPIRQAGLSGCPILGICLGMQLLADTSEEFGEHQGLGLIPGRILKLQPAGTMDRVPNIGWCDVHVDKNTGLFRDVPSGSAFYFMHSYYFHCKYEEDMKGVLSFGDAPVCVSVQRGNLFGVQFHPEKSQDSGLRVLDNFARLAGKA